MAVSSREAVSALVSDFKFMTMKKALYILAIAVMSIACSKGSRINPGSAAVGGNNTYTSSPLGQYMMHIADDLVAGALNELETSLLLEKSTVTWNSRFTGMAIVKDDEEVDTWLLTYEGPFTIDGCTYETRFSIVATREDIMDGQHGDWNVTVTGTRVEKEGYSCKFDNVGSLTYLTDGSRTGWNQIYGKLSMDVIKDKARIDTGLLVFNGTPSAAQFVRGL